MKKSIFTFIILLHTNLVFGQFADNFSDGNFTANPAWSGNIGNFEVDSFFKLHLNDSITNSSYLTTQSQAIISANWEFEIKLEFDPSTSNYAKVYLVSDQEDLTGDLNGFYVKIGGASGTVGFGTPTHKNSQELINQSIGEININPKSFTPNNDGYKDVASINSKFSENTLMATIKIFDSEGRVVKNILNNEMIGNSGNTTWDGTSEEGLQLNTGMYIVWMEVFSDNGNAERFKEVIVLSR
jgi:gliding motility-associated-like protein